MRSPQTLMRSRRLAMMRALLAALVVASVCVAAFLGECFWGHHSLSTPSRAASSSITKNFLNFTTLLRDGEVFPDKRTPVLVAVSLNDYKWADLKEQILALHPAPVTVVFFKCPNQLGRHVYGGSTPWSVDRSHYKAPPSSASHFLNMRGHTTPGPNFFGDDPPNKHTPGDLDLPELTHSQNSAWGRMSFPPKQNSAQQQRTTQQLGSSRQQPDAQSSRTVTKRPAFLRLGDTRKLLTAPPADEDLGFHKLCMNGHLPNLTVAIHDLLDAYSHRVNFLVYGSSLAPNLVTNMALLAVQRQKHIRRMAIATQEGLAVTQVVVIDPASQQRTEFQRNSFNVVFENIYTRKTWSDAGLGSGPGSTVAYTKQLREQLVPLLLELGVKTMVDAPCGALAWMPEVLERVGKQVPDFRYYGLDITCSVVASAAQRFHHQPSWHFRCVDVSEGDFPLTSPDLVFSRDALQHLPYTAIHNFLHNVKRHKAKYLLVGSYLNDTANVNIRAGDYFKINLLKPPFNLRPPPLRVVMEHETRDKHDPQKYMLLIDVEKMEWDEPKAPVWQRTWNGF